MKIGVMILEGPYQHQAVDSAYYFVKAAVQRGHEIVGIFLFTDGVNNVNKFISPPGERNISQRLAELGKSGINIIACTACAKFRGMKPDLAVEGVRLSGLGSLAEFLRSSDRFITFGN
jgi:tRNA 2-thiouridine synthesizing protein D